MDDLIRIDTTLFSRSLGASGYFFLPFGARALSGTEESLPLLPCPTPLSPSLRAPGRRCSAAAFLRMPGLTCRLEIPTAVMTPNITRNMPPITGVGMVAKAAPIFPNTPIRSSTQPAATITILLPTCSAQGDGGWRRSSALARLRAPEASALLLGHHESRTRGPTGTAPPTQKCPPSAPIRGWRKDEDATLRLHFCPHLFSLLLSHLSSSPGSNAPSLRSLYSEAGGLSWEAAAQWWSESQSQLCL